MFDKILAGAWLIKITSPDGLYTWAMEISLNQNAKSNKTKVESGHLWYSLLKTALIDWPTN